MEEEKRKVIQELDVVIEEVEHGFYIFVRGDFYRYARDYKELAMITGALVKSKFYKSIGYI